jgi:hypothetical protein
MMLNLSMLVAGIVLLTVTTYVFWLLGKEGRISPRWRDSNAMEAIWVFGILSGWAAGGCLIAQSLIGMIAA